MSYLPELLAFPLYPLLLWQGKRTRARTPRLPEANGPPQGLVPAAGQGAVMRLLAIGESPVAGVGVGTQEQAITGQFALALAHHFGVDVAWHAVGKNGADLAQALQCLIPVLPPYSAGAPLDIALVAFGVNDSTSFRSSNRYRQELETLLALLQQRCQPRHILLSGVPPLQLSPALPEPLRTVLGLKAAALDQVARQVAKQRSGVVYAALPRHNGDPGLLAGDGYHPSEQGTALWAAQLLKVFLENCRTS